MWVLSEAKLARVLSGERNEVAHAVDVGARIGGDQLGHADDEANGSEISLDVEVKLVEQRIDGVRGQREEERIAVGRGFGGHLGAHSAAGATAVFDDDRLAERLGKRMLNDARNDVRATTRRVRHD